MQRRGALISANILKASGGVGGGGSPPHDIRGSHDAATGCLNFILKASGGIAGGLGGAAAPPMTFEAVMMQRRGALISASILKASGGIWGGGGRQPPPKMFEALMIQQRGALISAHILTVFNLVPPPPPHAAKQTNWPSPCLQGLFPAWKLTFSVKVRFLGSKLLADPFKRLVSPWETKVFGGRGKVCFFLGN